MIGKYYESHPNPPRWWMMSAPRSSKEMGNVVMSHTQAIQAILRDYRDTNVLTERIVDKFSGFRTDIRLDEEHSATFLLNSQSEAELRAAPTAVCYIPRDQQRQIDVSPLFYDQGWGVLIYAIDWPEKVLPAALMHEFGHGLARAEGWPEPPKQQRPNFASLSPEGADEEVVMHGTIEAEVLNRASGGAFLDTIERIIGPLAKKRVGIPGFQEYLSLAQFQELDRTLDCENCSSLVAGILSVEYSLVLGFRYIDLTVANPQARTKAKRDYYLLFAERGRRAWSTQGPK